MKKIPLIGLLLGGVAAAFTFLKRDKQNDGVIDVQELPRTPGTSGPVPTTQIDPDPTVPQGGEAKDTRPTS